MQFSPLVYARAVDGGHRWLSDLGPRPVCFWMRNSASGESTFSCALWIWNLTGIAAVKKYSLLAKCRREINKWTYFKFQKRRRIIADKEQAMMLREGIKRRDAMFIGHTAVGELKVAVGCCCEHARILYGFVYSSGQWMPAPDPKQFWRLTTATYFWSGSLQRSTDQPLIESISWLGWNSLLSRDTLPSTFLPTPKLAKMFASWRIPLIERMTILIRIIQLLKWWRLGFLGI